MNKKMLVETIIVQMEKDLAVLKAAALATLEAATGEESKPENQYDTRALEASYLAGAQANRAAEVETSLNTYRFLELKEFNATSPIQATAVVELDLDGKIIFVFLVPVRGGITISFNSKLIQVITPKSPLGEALLGLKVGDVAVVEKDEDPLEYEILSVH